MLHRNIRILLSSAFVVSLSVGVSYPYLSEYVYSITGSSIIAGIIPFTVSIIGIPLLAVGGYLADTFGRRRIIFFGTILLGFSQLLYSIANDSYWLFAAAFIEGLSYIYFPAFTALIMDSSRTHQFVEVFTLDVIVSHTPYMVSPILGGVLRDLYGVSGLRVGFMLCSIIVLAIALVRLFSLSETMNTTGDIRDLASSILKIGESLNALNSNIRRLIIIRVFLACWLSMLFYFTVLYVTRYVRIVSFTEWGLISVSSSVFYILTYPIAKIVKNLKPARTYVFMVLLESLASILIIQNMKYTLLVSMILLNICGALTYAIERAIVAEFTVQSMRGRVESFMNISFYLGSALGYITGGYLYNYNPQYIFLTAAIFLAVGSILINTLLKHLEPIK